MNRQSPAPATVLPVFDQASISASSAASHNVSLSAEPSSISRSARARVRTLSNGNTDAPRGKVTSLGKRCSKPSRDTNLKAEKDMTHLEHNEAPSAQELIAVLQNELKSIRELITCKICYSPLYEPYTTSCGHTFCYNCFCKTFEPHKPKNCPECRTSLHAQPVPAFTIRAITRQLIKRPELLVEDETLEGHTSMVNEHEQLVKADRESSGGLFHGLFRAPRHACPCCDADMFHGACAACGYNAYGEVDYSDEDSYDFNDGLSEITVSDDQDEDFDMEDADHGFDAEVGSYDDDVLRMAGYLNGEEPIPANQQDAIIQRYLHETGHYDRSFSSHPLESHSMAGNRAGHRRPYAASAISEFGDTEMNTVVEENEDEDDEDEDDEEVDDSDEEEDEGEEDEVDDDTSVSIDDAPDVVNPSTPRSILHLETESGHDISTDSQVSSDQDDLTSDSELESEAETAIPSPVGSAQFREALNVQQQYPSTASEGSSALTSRSASGTSSRRRQRESTPTSSAGQPRQRRRIGSVVNLASIDSQHAISSSRNSSHQAESSDASSSASEDQENASDNSTSSEDMGDDSTQEGVTDGYVSLADETGEEDSDGAETTVGWEEGRNSPSIPRLQSQQSATRPTVQTHPRTEPSPAHNAEMTTVGDHIQQVYASAVASSSRQRFLATNTNINNVSPTAPPTRVGVTRSPESTSQMTSHRPASEHGSWRSEGPIDIITTTTSSQSVVRPRDFVPTSQSVFHHAHADRAATRTLSTNNDTEASGESGGVLVNGNGRLRLNLRSRTSTPLQGHVPISPNGSTGTRAHQLALQRAVLLDAQRRDSLVNINPAMRSESQSLDSAQPASIPHMHTSVRGRITPNQRLGMGLPASTEQPIEHFDSRTGQRPISAIGRRTPIVRPSHGAAAYNQNILDNTAWTSLNHISTGNPFVRHRTSRRQLNSNNSPNAIRPIPSITTLRQQASRGMLRTGSQPLHNRPPSRTQSRNQPRSLNHTPSMIRLPQAEGMQTTSAWSRSSQPAMSLRNAANTSGAFPANSPSAGARIGSGVNPDDRISRIHNAMDQRAALIAGRHNGARATQLHRETPTHLTDLHSLRLSTINPHRAQPSTGNHRQATGTTAGHTSTTDASNFINITHAQHPSPARNRGTLAQGPSEGLLPINVSQGIPTPIDQAVSPSAVVIAPRLTRQRDQRTAATNVYGSTGVSAPTMRTILPGDRWGGPRTLLGAADVSLRHESRLTMHH